MKTPSSVPYSNISRLPRYHRFLSELSKEGRERISSGELAEIMGVTSSQIRQDFKSFGLTGQQGYGYNVSDILDEIAVVLGLNKEKKAVLVGSGNLGRAIGSLSFSDKGFRLIGVFDANKALTGKKVGKCKIADIEDIDEFCRTEKPEAAFLCIPEEQAPAIVSKLIDLGIRAFWNFSHYDIKNNYPHATVENVHLSDSLMKLSYLLETKNEG